MHPKLNAIHIEAVLRAGETAPTINADIEVSTDPNEVARMYAELMGSAGSWFHRLVA